MAKYDPAYYRNRRDNRARRAAAAARSGKQAEAGRLSRAAASSEGARKIVARRINRARRASGGTPNPVNSIPKPPSMKRKSPPRTTGGTVPRGGPGGPRAANTPTLGSGNGGKMIRPKMPSKGGGKAPTRAQIEQMFDAQKKAMAQAKEAKKNKKPEYKSKLVKKAIARKAAKGVGKASKEEIQRALNRFKRTHVWARKAKNAKAARAAARLLAEKDTNYSYKKASHGKQGRDARRIANLGASQREGRKYRKNPPSPKGGPDKPPNPRKPRAPRNNDPHKHQH